MSDDGICVVFCHPNDALELIANDKDIEDSIVASLVIPEGEITVVSKDEFLKWLREGQ